MISLFCLHLLLSRTSQLWGHRQLLQEAEETAWDVFADTPVYRFILAITLSLSVHSVFYIKNMIASIMEILQDHSTSFQRTEKEKGGKNHIKILTLGICQLVSFPSFPWCGLTPPQSPRDPTPCGTLPGRKRRRVRMRRKPSATCLATGSTGTGAEKPFWLPSSLLLLLPQRCLSSSRSLPLSSLSCVSQSPSKVHHCYFPRLPSKLALAYGWKEMFPKSSCSSLNTACMLPAIKETFIVISPTIKLTKINLLGLGSLFFSFLTTSIKLLKKQQRRAFTCSFHFRQCSLFYRVLC